MTSLLADSKSELSEHLAGDLAEVQRRFAAELSSDLGCVNDLTDHVERYRGKMLRPTLALLAARAIEPERRTVSADQHGLATVVEMVHMATLVHDDILDDAELRRRGATINRLRGNEAAVMLGDYLISHAYHLCSSLGEPAISRAIAEATNRVCEGELLQLSRREDWSLDEPTYFEVIRRKTASFCGRCCELAGRLAGSDGATTAALYEYGEKLGLAFQIIDDVLDLTGESDRVGKTLGRDLEKGKLTLPMIRYLDSLSETGRHQVRMRFTQPAPASPHALDQGRAGGTNRHDPTNGHSHAPAEQQVAWLAGELQRTGAIAEARTCAEQLVVEAKAALTRRLPQSPARQMLLSMADAVLNRDC